jgi:nucleotidyltransferase substrate binding protein (TIGR01987 family)
MTKSSATVEQFRKATERLREALLLERNEIVRDSAILRFEIALDLSWKALKAHIEENLGVVCYSPKGLIDYDEAWLDFAEMRNETAHTYNEQFAEELFARLPEAARHFESLVSKLHSLQS